MQRQIRRIISQPAMVLAAIKSVQGTGDDGRNEQREKVIPTLRQQTASSCYGSENI